jgi:hypothetical protein
MRFLWATVLLSGGLFAACAAEKPYVVLVAKPLSVSVDNNLSPTYIRVEGHVPLGASVLVDSGLDPHNATVGLPVSGQTFYVLKCGRQIPVFINFTKRIGDAVEAVGGRTRMLTGTVDFALECREPVIDVSLPFVRRNRAR